MFPALKRPQSPSKGSDEIFEAGTEALGSKAVDEKVSEISARKLELVKVKSFF